MFLLLATTPPAPAPAPHVWICTEDAEGNVDVWYDAPKPSEARITVECPLPIYEDDPRWDCHTMGNLVCGPPRPAHLFRF